MGYGGTTSGENYGEDFCGASGMLLTMMMIVMVVVAMAIGTEGDSGCGVFSSF